MARHAPSSSDDLKLLPERRTNEKTQEAFIPYDVLK
jgi:hypothetical protein